MYKLKFNNILAIIFLMASVFVIVSCGDKEEEEEEMEGTCMTDDLTYGNFAADLINGSCATSGCHNADANSNGTFPMNNFETVSTAVDNGRILGAINWEDGFSNMPKGGDQLSDCNIEKMTAWINAGAPE